MRTITTIDSHVAGQLVRFVVDGVPRALGGTPVEKAAGSAGTRTRSGARSCSSPAGTRT